MCAGQAQACVRVGVVIEASLESSNATLLGAQVKRATLAYMDFPYDAAAYPAMHLQDTLGQFIFYPNPDKFEASIYWLPVEGLYSAGEAHERNLMLCYRRAPQASDLEEDCQPIEAEKLPRPPKRFLESHWGLTGSLNQGGHGLSNRPYHPKLALQALRDLTLADAEQMLTRLTRSFPSEVQHGRAFGTLRGRQGGGGGDWMEGMEAAVELEPGDEAQEMAQLMLDANAQTMIKTLHISQRKV